MSYSGVLAEIRRQAVRLAERGWPDLGRLIDSILPNPLDPTALLPIMTGMAAGGRMDGLIPAAAAVLLTDVSLRIIDDCADMDAPDALYLTVGVGRAVNYAMALNTIVAGYFAAGVHAPQLNTVFQNYCQSLLTVCQGQDRDMLSPVTSLAEYEELVRLKTVTAYEFATSVGGQLVINDPHALVRCANCGIHLGWMAQILDDIEALWFPVIEAKRELQKMTLPLLVGLNMQGASQRQLAALVVAAEWDRVAICTLLDEMDVRRQLMHLALDHRDQALLTLDEPFLPEGKTILSYWLDWLLANAANLLMPLNESSVKKAVRDDHFTKSGLRDP